MLPFSSMIDSQDARGDLRMSMANDERTLKNENLAVQEADQMLSTPGYPEDKTFNFQKKVTLEKMIGFPYSLAGFYFDDNCKLTWSGKNTLFLFSYFYSYSIRPLVLSCSYSYI